MWGRGNGNACTWSGFQRTHKTARGKASPSPARTLATQRIFRVQPCQLLYILPDTSYTDTDMLFNFLTYGNSLCTSFSLRSFLWTTHLRDPSASKCHWSKFGHPPWLWEHPVTLYVFISGCQNECSSWGLKDLFLFWGTTNIWLGMRWDFSYPTFLILP